EAKLITTTNGATISYNATGTYTAGLTLKNMWGSSETKSVDIIIVPYPDGVEESVVEQMSVYPNPFTDYVNLSFAKEGKYTIEIVALDGKLIESKSLSVDTNEIVRVDIDGDKGIYILKVVAQNQSVVRTIKVVKR
ncbi:MAG: T9SS type A sorting domain-containing protein, partial [Bacteroidaceae bacterium]|nr:T9SS type A sorting domain-containing protein [Bacteroidaceae bacterium]